MPALRSGPLRSRSANCFGSSDAEVPCAGTVFHWEPNPKLLCLMQGSRGSRVFRTNTFPQHLRRGGHSAALGRGAGSPRRRVGGGGAAGPGREEGRPTWTTGPGGGRGSGGAGQSARPAAGQPLPARAPADPAQLRSLRAAGTGRTDPACGCRQTPAVESRPPSTGAAFLRQFRTCLRRDAGTFTASLRRRWAARWAPAGILCGEIRTWLRL